MVLKHLVLFQQISSSARYCQNKPLYLRINSDTYTFKYTHNMTTGTTQAQQAFVQKVYDIIEAYLEANDCAIYASDGVYVYTQLTPSIMDEADAENPDRFYPLCSLIREDEETIEADAELVKEIALQYFAEE